MEGKLPEEEVAGREPDLRAKEAEKSKVVFKIHKKGLVNVSNSSLYRFSAKPSRPTSSRVTRSSPRSTRIRRGMRSGESAKTKQICLMTYLGTIWKCSQ